jgi:glycosyltransferase involved in cell wall biosynthesis
MIHRDIVIVADMDLNKVRGDVIRTLSFASQLRDNGFNVTILSSKLSNDTLAIDLHGINLIQTSVKNEGGSIINILSRTMAIIKKANELRKSKELKTEPVFIIETSIVGGYFAWSRFPKYILDVHGIYYNEIDYQSLPWYIPKGLYRRYNKYLEKSGARNAEKIITVSDSMSEFITNEFNVPTENVNLIPNGYFDYKINEVLKKDIKEEKGWITFLGNLSKWANIDKIIRAARKLENNGDIKFFILGDGPYRKRLEEQLNTYCLKNVNFTGTLPLDEAYIMIVKSEIMLSPFFDDLYAKVACPIKVLEYMAFGKAMVIDEVDDISRLLKENNAALTCNPKDEEEFVNNILLLLKDKNLKAEIGKNALALSREFSWEKQGVKLVCILKDF